MTLPENALRTGIARRLAARLGLGGSDAGMTLVEVLVALILTVIVFAIMIPALLPYMKLISATKIRSTSTSDAEIVFERIDSEVRFAYAINQQGYGATAIANPSDASIPAQRARYVEWLTPAASSPTGKNLCTQWRFVPATNSIEERQWNLDSYPPATFTQRLELAIDQPPADAAGATPAQNEDAWGRPTYPFAMISASHDGSAPLQALTVWVYAGRSQSDATTQIKTRFVARNSDIDVVTNSITGSGWGDTSLYGYGRDASGVYGTSHALPTALKVPANIYGDNGTTVLVPAGTTTAAGTNVSLVCDATVSGTTVTAFPAGYAFRP